MNNAELREFCTQMIGKFKLLSDIQKEMQYETIDAKFTEWELKKLIFALNVLREEVRKYVDTADTPQTDLVEDSPSLVKDLVKAFGEDGTWLERQGVYTLTLAEAKQRAVDIIESVLAKDEPTTQTETENSNLTFEKVMEEIQTQVIEFPDTHQKFTFARKIEMDGDSIKIGGWEYKGVKDAERFVKGSEQTERSSE